MLDVKLITKDDIKKYKQLSYTIKSDNIDQFILEAQIQDVAPLLGERLFNAVIKAPEDFEALLDGGEYTVGGETFINYGLKACLAHYAYSRYRYGAGIVETPTGFVQKLSGQDSQPESETTCKNQYNLNRDTAFTIWKSVENYLIRTDNELFAYTVLGCKRKQPERRPGGFRLSKIG